MSGLWLLIGFLLGLLCCAIAERLGGLVWVLKELWAGIKSLVRQYRGW